MNRIHFEIKSFNELSIIELYKILRLRAAVFVVEQNCVYQDIDDKDQKALHVLGYKNQEIVAYTRIFDSGDYFTEASIGRIVVSKTDRKYGYGHDLMKKSIEGIEKIFSSKSIKISAQCYLKKFYENHGFLQIGDDYLEDGIPHIAMIR